MKARSHGSKVALRWSRRRHHLARSKRFVGEVIEPDRVRSPSFRTLKPLAWPRRQLLWLLYYSQCLLRLYQRTCLVNGAIWLQIILQIILGQSYNVCENIKSQQNGACRYIQLCTIIISSILSILLKISSSFIVNFKTMIKNDKGKRKDNDKIKHEKGVNVWRWIFGSVGDWTQMAALFRSIMCVRASQSMERARQLVAG